MPHEQLRRAAHVRNSGRGGDDEEKDHGGSVETRSSTTDARSGEKGSFCDRARAPAEDLADFSRGCSWRTEPVATNAGRTERGRRAEQPRPPQRAKQNVPIPSRTLAPSHLASAAASCRVISRRSRPRRKNAKKGAREDYGDGDLKRHEPESPLHDRKSVLGPGSLTDPGPAPLYRRVHVARAWHLPTRFRRRK